ncbi:PepSY domain-containing protein [Actinoplanes sp. NEAU-A12]|uniref:PepSY domain-containing protein n=1 Tax=Actinoplanes sandaracinus TaxID=3045177 RepID=A0ABT6X0Y2_9ACTN|nr:PepSY domain-containing protein [Actinoplanes sandaracinus]MDI6105674.1 PepSY domain-containing protein [Actinoplanes sandaracinus]
MNTGKLRSKRVIIAGVAVAAALGAGGTVLATAASADEVAGGDRDRIGNAATQAVPGTVVEVEESDDQGEAYEVEVRKADGAEVTVILDKDLKVLSQEAEGPDGADGPVLTAEQRTSAETAARDAVGGGTVLDVEAAGVGGTAAYEAEVSDAAGKEWDVELDAAFKVLTKTADDD